MRLPKRLSVKFPSLDSPYPEIQRFRRRTVIVLLVFSFLILPAMNLAGVVESNDMNRMGRYMCFAIAALGLDLIWGFTGILSLCHALFFCLGGYAMAMHLSLPSGGGDVRAEYNDIPQFFFFNSVDILPSWWKPFSSLPFAVVASLLVPMLVALVLGFFIFRNRVRGVYFAILTQALAWGAFLAFSRNEMLLGGTNGLTNFYKPLNTENTWILGMYLLVATTLVLTFWACSHITRSRFGRILLAIRDNETRLYFTGHRADLYKVFVFSVAALIGGLAGMLYVPQNGIITPNIMQVADSIWMVIWVAVGGRGKLWGAVFGALLVNYTYSILTTDMPTAWPFIQGILFVGILFFPNGIAGLWERLESEVRSGSSIRRLLFAFVFVDGFLIVDKLGFFPAVGSNLLVAGLEVQYLVMLAGAALICWGRVAHTAIPLAALVWFILTEAMGLMPQSLDTIKYVVLLVSLVVYAYLRWSNSPGRGVDQPALRSRVLMSVGLK
jgi:urea transport system permease protein